MINIKNIEDFSSQKIKKFEEILKEVNKSKKEGKRIGLCVGGYDLLHPGHMKHLSSAKKYCDILIVAITADKFNSIRKGSGRPIYPEQLRAFSVSQLESVNLVFISNHSGALEVIQSIKPDFYIKGPDYIKKETPGITLERQAIASIGGEIKYTKDEKLFTTEIIGHIKNCEK